MIGLLFHEDGIIFISLAIVVFLMTFKFLLIFTTHPKIGPQLIILIKTFKKLGLVIFGICFSAFFFGIIGRLMFFENKKFYNESGGEYGFKLFNAMFRRYSFDEL